MDERAEDVVELAAEDLTGRERVPRSRELTVRRSCVPVNPSQKCMSSGMAETINFLNL
jgi:hypothetical protein